MTCHQWSPFFFLAKGHFKETVPDIANCKVFEIYISENTATSLNTLRPRWREQQHFTDNIFKCIFFNENVQISIKISLKFVPKGPIYNIPALVQIMAWRRSGDKPLSEPMMVSLPTHICVTRPQWVKNGYQLHTTCECWNSIEESWKIFWNYPTMLVCHIQVTQYMVEIGCVLFSSNLFV